MSDIKKRVIIYLLAAHTRLFCKNENFRWRNVNKWCQYFHIFVVILFKRLVNRGSLKAEGFI